MSSYRTCKYYYTNTTGGGSNLDGGGTAGVAVGAVVGAAIIIFAIVCGIKKCKQKNLERALAQNNKNNQMNPQPISQLNITTQNLATEYSDPNQQFMYQGQPGYGQPMMGQTPMPPMQPGYGGYAQPPPLYNQPMQPTPVYFQPTDQPPMPPIPPNLYGPNPILR